MKASHDAIELIKASESLAKVRKDGMVQAYPDPARGWDIPTIGWGSTGPDILKTTVWSVSQCDTRLIKQVGEVADDITEALGSTKTTQHQFDAFVDFAYNLGVSKFKGSTLFKLHKAGKTAEAANQFPLWNKANGVVLGGLTARRNKEKELYLRAS